MSEVKPQDTPHTPRFHNSPNLVASNWEMGAILLFPEIFF